jgi:hypothetical protein
MSFSFANFNGAYLRLENPNDCYFLNAKLRAVFSIHTFDRCYSRSHGDIQDSLRHDSFNSLNDDNFSKSRDLARFSGIPRTERDTLQRLIPRRTKSSEDVRAVAATRRAIVTVAQALSNPAISDERGSCWAHDLAAELLFVRRFQFIRNRNPTEMRSIERFYAFCILSRRAAIVPPRGSAAARAPFLDRREQRKRTPAA